MSYADFDYYSTQYSGTLIPEEKFQFVAEKASDRIKEAIFDREITDKHMARVRRCCCELADEIYRASDDDAEYSNVSSEKIGEYSVTFRSRSEILQNRKLLNENCSNIIRRYLANTGLLYQGVDI